MLDTNSEEFQKRVGTLTGVLTKRLNLVEDNPVVLISSLTRLLAVTIVSETINRSFPEVRAECLTSFAQALNGAREKLEAVLASESPANGH